MDVQICIVDHCGLPQTDLENAAGALTLQAQQHIGLPPPSGWGVSASVRVCTEMTPPRANEWILGLFTTADQPGALGYHDKTPSGLPMLHVFPPLDAQDGVPWTVTASHEMAEALVDSSCSDGSQDQSGLFWAKEISDAVEQDTYSMPVGPAGNTTSVPVSNFVLPAWFDSSSKGPYDYLHKLTAPFALTPGGYSQKFDPTAGWQQVQSSERPPRAFRQMENIPGRRSAKRRIPLGSRCPTCHRLRRET